MKPPITISADFAYELCDVLATMCGLVEGTANVVTDLKATADPLIARAEALADKVRPLLAESIAEEMMKEARR